MRQVTATEKYRAVNEGKMAKGEFVRQMRMAYPTVISQWNSYNDTVTILKNRGFISEKTGVDTYDSRMELNISPASIDRGVRYELQAQGHDPAETTDKQVVANVTDRVVKNLKKDPLHYINLLAKESSNVDKHDREEEVKRGEAKKDVFNGEKKADLREDIESARDNIIKVASVIRGKYGEIPGFTPILKDFLQTHQEDVKAGKVTDPIAKFDGYIEDNYRKIKEENADKDGYVDVNKAADRYSELERDFIFFIQDTYGKNLSADEIMDDFTEWRADKHASLEEKQGKDKDGYNTDPNVSMYIDDDEWEQEMGRGVKENYGPDMAQIFSIIEDRASDSGFDVQEEAMEVMEAIGQEYEIDFEFGAGPSRQAEAKGKDHDGDGDIDSDDYMAAKDKAIKKAMGKDEIVREHVKNIITKVLEEQMINEAATAELARLADDYAEFEGMKQSIIALQDIVTDIESFYDKTRDKIQKVYDSIGEIRNEEGLKVGGFLAPTIETAFNKDLRPAVRRGFTSGLETPKVKTISRAEVDAARAAGDIEEEPKQTLFTPVNENITEAQTEKLSDFGKNKLIPFLQKSGFNVKAQNGQIPREIHDTIHDKSDTKLAAASYESDGKGGEYVYVVVSKKNSEVLDNIVKHFNLSTGDNKQVTQGWDTKDVKTASDNEITYQKETNLGNMQLVLTRRGESSK